MAHFLCHLGAHILEPFCSISILPKTVVDILVQCIPILVKVWNLVFEVLKS